MKIVVCKYIFYFIDIYRAETWTFRAVEQEHLENCGAGEGWRSVGPIMCEIKKYYL
jgi:hypothetical protein